MGYGYDSHNKKHNGELMEVIEKLQEDVKKLKRRLERTARELSDEG